MRSAVKNAAKHFPTAIISGRRRDMVSWLSYTAFKAPIIQVFSLQSASFVFYHEKCPYSGCISRSMIWWELLNFTMLVVMEWTSDTRSGTQLQYLMTISNLRNFQTSRFASLSLLHLMGAPVILKLS